MARVFVLLLSVASVWAVDECQVFHMETLCQESVRVLATGTSCVRFKYRQTPYCGLICTDVSRLHYKCDIWEILSGPSDVIVYEQSEATHVCLLSSAVAACNDGVIRIACHSPSTAPDQLGIMLEKGGQSLAPTIFISSVPVATITLMPMATTPTPTPTHLLGGQSLSLTTTSIQVAATGSLETQHDFGTKLPLQPSSTPDFGSRGRDLRLIIWIFLGILLLFLIFVFAIGIFLWFRHRRERARHQQQNQQANHLASGEPGSGQLQEVSTSPKLSQGLEVTVCSRSRLHVVGDLLGSQKCTEDGGVIASGVQLPSKGCALPEPCSEGSTESSPEDANRGVFSPTFLYAAEYWRQNSLTGFSTAADPSADLDTVCEWWSLLDSHSSQQNCPVENVSWQSSQERSDGLGEEIDERGVVTGCQDGEEPCEEDTTTVSKKMTALVRPGKRSACKKTLTRTKSEHVSSVNSKTVFSVDMDLPEAKWKVFKAVPDQIEGSELVHVAGCR